MAAPRSILVVRLSSLGDVLLTAPAVQAIKTAMPRTSLSWLVEGGVARLIGHQSFVDRVIEFPRGRLASSLRRGALSSASLSLASFWGALRKEEYDLVIDFHGIAKSAILSKMARANRRIGFDTTYAKEGSWLVYDQKVPGEKRMHKVERNRLLASAIGVREFPEVNLETSPDADAYIDRFLAQSRIGGPLFAVNPFSSKGSEFKRWSMDNYGEVIRKTADDTGATMMVLWGPGEQEEATRLKKMAGGRALLACPTDVSQLLSLLRRTNLYIGGDTGVMHMAALAGVPVVAVFGPTDHLVNGPYGKGHTIVREELPCSPCRDKRCKSRECLGSVSVDRVLQAVTTAWDRAGGH